MWPLELNASVAIFMTALAFFTNIINGRKVF
jgi:hypothetical protein